VFNRYVVCLWFNEKLSIMVTQEQVNVMVAHCQRLSSELMGGGVSEREANDIRLTLKFYHAVLTGLGIKL